MVFISPGSCIPHSLNVHITWTLGPQVWPEPLVPMHSPITLTPQLSRGPRASWTWALQSFIFNCIQKYIYIKNAERCLFNSDTVYLLLNLCLGGQLTRNNLSITFRMLHAPWSTTSSRHFNHVCYSLWFPSSVISHQAAPNHPHQKRNVTSLE